MEDFDTIHFGVHFMVDGYGADPAVLSNAPTLTALLRDTPTQLGMHTITEPVVVEVGPMNQKDPGGLSGFVLIAESHMSFHTFPNRGFVTLDVYTCQNSLDMETLTNMFNTVFRFTDFETHYIERGTRYPARDIV